MRSKCVWLVVAIWILGELCVPGRLLANSYGKHLNKGKDLIAEGKYEPAIAEFQEALQIRPKSREAIDSLGLAYEDWGKQLASDGDTDRSIEAFQNALATRHDSIAAKLCLALEFMSKGDQLLGKGERDSAIAAYKNALAIGPDEPYWHEKLGIAIERTGDHDAALREYRKAAELLPLDEGLQTQYEKAGGNPLPTHVPCSEDATRMSSIGHRVVTEPTPVSIPDPGYTEAAWQAKLAGKVVMRILIDAKGNVACTSITKPLGLGLDAKALETIRTWKFKPGTRDGSPEPFRVMVEVGFRRF